MQGYKSRGNWLVEIEFNKHGKRIGGGNREKVNRNTNKYDGICWGKCKSRRES